MSMRGVALFNVKDMLNNLSLGTCQNAARTAQQDGTDAPTVRRLFWEAIDRV